MTARRVYRSLYHHFAPEIMPMLKNLLIDRQLRFAYLQIPKAACSTVKFNILQNYGSNLPENISQGALHADHLHWLTYESAELKSIFKTNKTLSLPIFTVVRNPFTRALSGYREKIELRKDVDKYITDLGLSTSKKICFDEFLDALLSRPQISIDSHFQAQSTIISNELIANVSIGHMENLDVFLSQIASAIFGRPMESKLATRATHTTGSSELEIIEKYYSSRETIEKVIQLYKDDFDNFNYSQHIENVAEPPRTTKAMTAFSPIDVSGLYKNKIIKLDLALRATFREKLS